ncbi:translocation/assembly module TamB domain-containing protein [Selenomonas ruminantium]|uniref:Translocation and assembly module TamB n=1 Tax=Selenomonas ruminantium TaxID=971 RepID=A0A1H0SMA3_SELRU|nr:translocation/assembly module TamB domain-containing protein [Selenomonas ruminantium]SDP42840.1 translocation and assembly module TamB [Selenomonas ruminantium]
MKGKTWIIGAVVMALIAITSLWYYVQTQNFMERAGGEVSSLATQALGTNVEIGEIEIKSLRDLELHNVAIYDKQAELIARADTARVSCRLLAAFSDPANAVGEVRVSGVEAVLSERADGSWNVEDLLSKEKTSQEFHGRILVDNAHVLVRRQGQELALEEVSGTVDLADYPVSKVEFAAQNQGTGITGTATLSDTRQIVNAHLDGVDIEKYLAFVPQGLIPENIKIEGGRLESADIHAYRRDGDLSFSGEGDLKDGRVQVEGTEIENIAGHASFTNEEVLLSVDAEAAEQKVNVHGKIKNLTTTPYLELEASSDSFDPSRILTNIPYQGAAKFTVKVTGAISNPSVDGKVQVAEGQVLDIPFTGAQADVRYQDKNLFVRGFSAQVFGGKVSGEAVLSTENLGYTAHVKLDDIDAAQGNRFLPQLAGLTGRVYADMGGNGIGSDLSTLQLYGSAKVVNAAYQGIKIDKASTSFYLADDDLLIDYLSVKMPNHSSLGLEGSIRDMRGACNMDLAYYGGHFDLSLLQNLDSRLELSGLSDFKGTIRGAKANPQVEIKFSGLKGKIFKQPFDSLKFAASGSLDGVGIDDFLMEKDGKEVWRAAGSVGFTGEKKVNLQLDTMGARMEDIVALIAPDQPLTGNVDNIIKLTGTLDNPQATGYIHFYRGSYHGVLLSGMDGDYFLENGKLRLQDFHAYSPMIDMVLNGTITTATQALDMEVVAKDIDLKRVEHKLPYEVSGHGTFKGKIDGTINAPEFHGVLEAPEIVMNGQTVNNLRGMVKFKGHSFDIDHFGFEQNGGTYDMELAYDTDTDGIRGDVVLQNADIAAVAALLNQKTEVISGRADLTASLSGTAHNPSASINGRIESGKAGGYDVRGVELDLNLNNNVVYINKLQGSQGEHGTFTASGTVEIGGAIDARFNASQLDFGMFTGLAGIKARGVTGTADIEAVLGGYTHNPAADVKVKAIKGGIQGADFDSLTGEAHLKNGLIDLTELRVEKAVGTKNCAATAKGIVPLRALTAGKDEWLDDMEQIQLSIGLQDADLSLLPTISKEIDWALGATEGEVKIHGTLAHPLMDGSVTIPNGAVKLKTLKEPVTDMTARLKFNGNQVTVEEFSGKMGGGSYNGSGKLLMNGLEPEHYDFSLYVEKLGIKSKFFEGPLNGELHLTDTDFYGQHLPKISGRIDFNKCKVSVPTIPDSEGEMPEMVFDVQVNAGDKVHFYSPYLYDLYLTGGFHVGGIMSHPKMSGSLQVKRGGTINYLKTEFKIREGTANFNQVASFMPSIDFFADTKLSQAKVFLSVKGPLGAAEMKLTSSPEMSQTQIIQLLTLRDAYKDGKTTMDMGDLLAVGLQMSFLSEVEGIMRQYLYLDKFSISRGSGSAFDTHEAEKENRENKYDFNVSMGKYITDKVMLRYTHGFGGDNINRYGVQYDVNDHWGVTVEREASKYIFGVEARVTF